MPTSKRLTQLSSVWPAGGRAYWHSGLLAVRLAGLPAVCPAGGLAFRRSGVRMVRPADGLVCQRSGRPGLSSWLATGQPLNQPAVQPAMRPGRPYGPFMVCGFTVGPLPALGLDLHMYDWSDLPQ